MAYNDGGMKSDEFETIDDYGVRCTAELSNGSRLVTVGNNPIKEDAGLGFEYLLISNEC
jgi:hypothetical protein